jgi:hypothetical protein
VIAEIEETEIEVNGQSYWVQWSFPMNFTFCAIIEIRAAGRCGPGAYGYAVCNPKDVYDRKIGMKWAARRACSVGDRGWWGNPLGPYYGVIYGQLRKFINERYP